jgi:Gram-negative porin
MAIVAAAGVLSTNAFAADLGGDCCADLEERVAELEATTARKGTRKTSLEIWGQVNKVIIAWNDSVNKNMALGVDNVSQSTRFGFRGNAKVNADLKAGYSIVVEWATGGRSTNISQFRDKGNIAGIANTNPPGAFGANDAAITMRESIWYLDSKSLGKLSVGRTDNNGPLGLVDLGGIALTVAPKSMSYLAGGLLFRTNATSVNPAAAGSGNFTRYSLANSGDAGADFSPRVNGVFYETPVLAGFTFAASYGGSLKDDGICANAACTALQGYGPIWGMQLKYAGEFSGVRVVASIGHEDESNSIQGGMPATNGTSIRPHTVNNGATLSMIHTSSGLFAQGQYNEFTRGHDVFSTTGGASVYNGVTVPTKDTARQLQIQAGIAKNWFGIGRTSLYGEWAKTTNGFNTHGLTGTNGDALVNGVSGSAGTAAYFGDSTTLKMWGLGINQSIEAAAMDLFAGYRNFSLTSDNCTTAGGCKDIGLFVAGSRIKF